MICEYCKREFDNSDGHIRIQQNLVSGKIQCMGCAVNEDEIRILQNIDSNYIPKYKCKHEFLSDGDQCTKCHKSLTQMLDEKIEKIKNKETIEVPLEQLGKFVSNISINLNHEFYFQLTDYGKGIYQEYLKSVYFRSEEMMQKYVYNCTYPDHLSLWEIAHIFGRGLYMGNSNQVFVKNELVMRKE